MRASRKLQKPRGTDPLGSPIVGRSSRQLKDTNVPKAYLSKWWLPKYTNVPQPQISISLKQPPLQSQWRGDTLNHALPAFVTTATTTHNLYSLLIHPVFLPILSLHKPGMQNLKVHCPSKAVKPRFHVCRKTSTKRFNETSAFSHTRSIPCGCPIPNSMRRGKRDIAVGVTYYYCFRVIEIFNLQSRQSAYFIRT